MISSILWLSGQHHQVKEIYRKAKTAKLYLFHFPNKNYSLFLALPSYLQTGNKCFPTCQILLKRLHILSIIITPIPYIYIKMEFPLLCYWSQVTLLQTFKRSIVKKKNIHLHLLPGYSHLFGDFKLSQQRLLCLHVDIV